MIIITGQGRSGTSVLAKLYVELGFDMGGEWNSQINAGFEAEGVVNVNKKIMKDLGLKSFDPPREKLTLAIVNSVPPQFPRVREHLQSILYRLPGMTNRSPGSMRWERLDKVVEKYRGSLQTLSGSYQVVKDPRFCFTLPVWALSGVKIDHVLVSVRSLEGILRSVIAIKHHFHSEESARNILVYGLGLCMTTLYTYRLNHSVVRFPDFLKSPEELFGAMRFPEPVERCRFLQTFLRLVHPGLVHDSS